MHGSLTPRLKIPISPCTAVGREDGHIDPVLIPVNNMVVPVEGFQQTPLVLSLLHTV